MDFEYSDRTKDLIERVQKFMDDVIYPGEKIYHEQLEASKTAGSCRR